MTEKEKEERIYYNFRSKAYMKCREAPKGYLENGWVEARMLPCSRAPKEIPCNSETELYHKPIAGPEKPRVVKKKNIVQCASKGE